MISGFGFLLVLICAAFVGGSFSPDGVGVSRGLAEIKLQESLDSKCISEPVMLEELKKIREQLDIKQKELSAKEVELKALETALSDELKKLEQVREDIAKIDTLRKKENEEKVTKLVETLETMSPKAAAQLLSTIDEILAVTAMSKMATPKLAKLMNLMDAGKSSRLTELLAGMSRAKSNSAAQLSLRKGGEKINDGQSSSDPAGNNAGKENNMARKPSGISQKGEATH